MKQVLHCNEIRARALGTGVSKIHYDDRLLGVSIYHAITANA